jgi:hypothetical protein
MPFEDVHRLVTTMRMAELILNDRVQTDRKEIMAEIKIQLDSKHCPNMTALPAEFQKAKDALTQKHSFRSIGAFDMDAYDLEGLILFETMLIARAVDWLARLSIDPRAKIRRGTMAVFSELQSAYTSQRTLHELYFHQHDDKKLLEERVRGAISEMGERLTRVAVNPTGGPIQKRQNIALELQGISSLVEEMLTMAKQLYSAALTASHMGHLAFEHTLTIAQLRQRNADLQDEIRSYLGDAVFARLNRCHDPCGREHRVGESQCRSFCPIAGASRAPTETNRNPRRSFDQRRFWAHHCRLTLYVARCQSRSQPLRWF